MTYAIIKTGGRQYRVAEGDTVDVDLLDVDAGKTATFGEEGQKGHRVQVQTAQRLSPHGWTSPQTDSSENQKHHRRLKIEKILSHGS